MARIPLDSQKYVDVTEVADHLPANPDAWVWRFFDKGAFRWPGGNIMIDGR
jgi:hypothetical protein